MLVSRNMLLTVMPHDVSAASQHCRHRGLGLRPITALLCRQRYTIDQWEFCLLA